MGRFVVGALVAISGMFSFASMAAEPSSGTPLYQKYGWALHELSVPQLRSDQAGDALVLVASPELSHGQTFVAAHIKTGRWTKVRSVWAVGASSLDRDELDLADDRSRTISRQQAISFMDEVEIAANLPPAKVSGAEVICTHGASYPYVMRRNGVITHGSLKTCGHEQTHQLVCQIVTGVPCKSDRPVWRHGT